MEVRVGIKPTHAAFAAPCVPISPTDHGAEEKFRTSDLRVFGAALYQLSYFGVSYGFLFLAGVAGLEPTTSEFGGRRSGQLSYTPEKQKTRRFAGGFHTGQEGVLAPYLSVHQPASPPRVYRAVNRQQGRVRIVFMMVPYIVRLFSLSSGFCGHGLFGLA